MDFILKCFLTIGNFITDYYCISAYCAGLRRSLLILDFFMNHYRSLIVKS